MVPELRTDRTELKVVSGQFLLHFDFGGILGCARRFLADGAALDGCLTDEVFVVEDDALEIVRAVSEFPQFLVNGGLVVQDSDDEFFGDVFTRTGSVLQYLFGLLQVD